MIPDDLLRATRILAERLAGADILWAVTGSLGQALQGLPLQPKDVDVQTDAPGAHQIAARMAEYIVQPVSYRVSARLRSHFGVLYLHGVQVEIMGDMQKRRPGEGWVPAPDLRLLRRYVEVGGLTIPVMDLAYEAEAYDLLGRPERARMLRDWLAGQQPDNQPN